MSENTPSAPIWPPVRIRSVPTAPVAQTHGIQLRAPLLEKSNQTQYRNGYTVVPKQPSYTPYRLPTAGRKHYPAFAIAPRESLSTIDPLSPNDWDLLARRVGLIPDNGHLRPLQIECSNIIVNGGGDVCVIGPTGCGKSLLWVLPLHAMGGGISLVITSYTSLGREADNNNHGKGVSSIFLCSEQNSAADFALAANGDMMVIYACIEMIESPSFARLLHADGWCSCLSAIYIDESHLVHESHTWRPAYSRIHWLRAIVGDQVALIPISATSPSSYQRSLITFAGLKPDYTLLNYGNFRPELSTVVLPLTYPNTSFKDLRFILQFGVRIADIVKSIIYSDDLELLTKMFWWVLSELAAAGLPAHLVDIIHSGLSEDHQKLCLEDFRDGRTMILLGSEKIGPGMNFGGVCRVLQYVCKDLTISKWCQRRGRGGRDENGSAVGYLIPEKALTSEGELSVENPGNQDPGIIDLIQSPDCSEFVYDHWLENPPRDKATTCGQCYRCCPTPLPGQEYEWVVVNPAPAENSGVQPVRTTDEEKEDMYQRLIDWRLQHWRNDWRDGWPSYGPNSLIPDSDLDNLAKHAGTVTTI
ncbi:P-loop containing nucleoside triphosphate hydrolase protein [Mycena capillaripes]|nr:P-loop containing nucleoside triphosphate hydrolase protein [Mycena capillaripes]